MCTMSKLLMSSGYDTHDNRGKMSNPVSLKFTKRVPGVDSVLNLCPSPDVSDTGIRDTTKSNPKVFLWKCSHKIPGLLHFDHLFLHVTTINLTKFFQLNGHRSNPERELDGHSSFPFRVTSYPPSYYFFRFSLENISKKQNYYTDT